MWPKDEYSQDRFFPKSGLFKKFSKKGTGDPPHSYFSLVGRLWIWMSMHYYPWISLNIWLCQGPEYAWSSYMFDRVLKMPRVQMSRGSEYVTILHASITQSSEYL